MGTWDKLEDRLNFIEEAHFLLNSDPFTSADTERVEELLRSAKAESTPNALKS